MPSVHPMTARKQQGKGNRWFVWLLLGLSCWLPRALAVAEREEHSSPALAQVREDLPARLREAEAAVWKTRGMLGVLEDVTPYYDTRQQCNALALWYTNPCSSFTQTVIYDITNQPGKIALAYEGMPPHKQADRLTTAGLYLEKKVGWSAARPEWFLWQPETRHVWAVFGTGPRKDAAPVACDLKSFAVSSVGKMNKPLPKPALGQRMPLPRAVVFPTTATTVNIPGGRSMTFTQSQRSFWYKINVMEKGVYEIEGTTHEEYTFVAARVYINESLYVDETDGTDYSDDSENYRSRMRVPLNPGTYYLELYCDIPATSSPVDAYFHISPDSNDIEALGNFAINRRDLATPIREVQLNQCNRFTMQSYMASESQDFAGARWQPYDTAPLFTLSPGWGEKTVYLKGLTKTGVESEVVKDKISLVPVRTLEINAETKKSQLATPRLDAWFQFHVNQAGFYRIESQGIEIGPHYLSLRGPDSCSTILAGDDLHNWCDCDDWRWSDCYGTGLGGSENASVMQAELQPGDYWIRLWPKESLATGYFTIAVNNRLQAPRITQCQINRGNPTASWYDVILTSAIEGRPEEDRIGEPSQKLAETEWQSFSFKNFYTFGAGEGKRTLCYQVRDKAGIESAWMSDSIEIRIPEVSTNGQPLTLRRTFDDEAAGCKFDVATTTTYRIEVDRGTHSSIDYSVRGPDNPQQRIWGPGLTLAPGRYWIKINGEATAYPATASVTVSPAHPEITSFSVFRQYNQSSSSRQVYLSYSYAGAAPLEYMASERVDFSDAQWHAHSGSKVFLLSPIPGTHTIYLKTRYAGGGESPVASATIELGQPATPRFSLNINGGAPWTGTTQVQLGLAANWVPDTWCDQLRVQVSERPSFSDASWQPYQSTIPFTLSSNPGNKTIYVRVRLLDRDFTYSKSIELRSPQPPQILSFYLENDAVQTSWPRVRLNISVNGSCAEYLASEDPAFRDATWQPYTANPWYFLTAAPDKKQVYVKIRDVAGQESLPASDVITLLEASFTCTLTARSQAYNDPAGITYKPSILLLFNADSSLQQASWIASEDPEFRDATWAAYDGSPTFELSPWNGIKTIYYRVKLLDGRVSPVQSSAIELKPLPVPWLRLENLNDGTTATSEREVLISPSIYGGWKYCLASEDPQFKNAQRIPRDPNNDPRFTLSAGNGWHTVYIKFLLNETLETETKICRIYLDQQLVQLHELDTWLPGRFDFEGAVTWYRLDVKTLQNYRFKLHSVVPSHSNSFELSLWGPQSQTTPMGVIMETGEYDDQEDDESTQRQLNPGVYYLRIVGTGWRQMGHVYDLLVTPMGRQK